MLFWQPITPLALPVNVFNSCSCNEAIGIRMRVLMETGPSCTKTLRRLNAVGRAVSAWIGPRSPMSGEWISNYRGRKLNTYRQAQDSLYRRPIHRRDAHVFAFVKREKMVVNDELPKDPRIIQARGPRYGIELGNYLKPLEHSLYELRGTGRLRHWFPNSRLVAKGLDQYARARCIAAKLDKFPNGCAVSLDLSRFDAHCSVPLLRVEHAVYQRCYPEDRHLQRLLAWQLRNYGHSPHDVHYVCEGGRMSGDMNTALGNCLLMLLMVALLMRELNLRPHEWDALDDGDDCILFFNRVHLDRVKAHAPGFFARCGHKLKIENVAFDLAEVAFCQSHVVQTVLGPLLVKDPIRTISRTLSGCLHWDEKFRMKYITLLGVCELSLSMGVPILQEYSRLLLRSGGDLPKGPAFYERMFAARMTPYPIGPKNITTQARLDFWQAFDIDADTQRRLEATLAACTLRRDGSIVNNENPSEKEETTFYWNRAEDLPFCSGPAYAP